MLTPLKKVITHKNHTYYAIMNITRKTPNMYCSFLFVRKELAEKYKKSFERGGKNRTKLIIAEVII